MQEKLTKFRHISDENLTPYSGRWIGSGRWLSMAMLATLHIALWAGVESIWSRPFLFAHLGLFLLWQPLWRGEERLTTRSAVTIVGFSVIALIWLNWWILAFWVSGLFSLVGGRVFTFQSIWQRVRYLLVMGYLLAVLLFWVAPQLFELSKTSEASRSLMEVVLPLLLVLMLVVPHEFEKLKKSIAVDLIYSILLFMLLTLLVLGSLAFMTLGHVDYFQALMRTLFVMALLLFVLGWLWNPRLGFTGFQSIFLHYFFNIGTPFEHWIKQLAQTAQQDISPSAYLNIATGYLVEIPWLAGLTWKSDVGQGTQGGSSLHRIEVLDHDLHLVLFARQQVAPAVLMHIKLLSQMLAYFYQSKRREQRLREMVHLQAVHETGARLTHDLKNMLQSLLALISIAEQKPSQAQPILQSQLPMLAQRIELTLNKLKTPKQEADTSRMPLAQWWLAMQQRHQFRNLEWVSDGDLDGLSIPFALFDSIVDNLIDNARNKRLREPATGVQVSLRAHPLSLSVCDSGSAIPENLASQLLQTVMESEDGFGVGLFQSARLAEQSGFRLELMENLRGKVCFELTEAPKR
jgi:signal transduction histidine kinase